MPSAAATGGVVEAGQRRRGRGPRATLVGVSKWLWLVVSVAKSA
jgi:hypothetical protein